jgi:hypothetical protein
VTDVKRLGRERPAITSKAYLWACETRDTTDTLDPAIALVVVFGLGVAAVDGSTGGRRVIGGVALLVIPVTNRRRRSVGG